MLVTFATALVAVLSPAYPTIQRRILVYRKHRGVPQPLSLLGVAQPYNCSGTILGGTLPNSWQYSRPQSLFRFNVVVVAKVGRYSLIILGYVVVTELQAWHRGAVMGLELVNTNCRVLGQLPELHVSVITGCGQHCTVRWQGNVCYCLVQKGYEYKMLKFLGNNEPGQISGRR